MSKFLGTLMASYDNDKTNVFNYLICDLTWLCPGNVNDYMYVSSHRLASKLQVYVALSRVITPAVRGHD